jgi:hypothetical protein
MIELYVMRKENGIYKYCMIEKAPIPFSKTVDVYPLIHTLMTLRYAVASTIHEIMYFPSSEDEYNSSGKISKTIATPD